jgi:hypothetical protein
VDWIHLIQDRVQWRAFDDHCNELAVSIKGREYFDGQTTFITNQNDIHDEIKSRLNSGNTCSYSVQNILSFRLI